MTSRHIIDGLMRATGSKDHQSLSRATGLHTAEISRMYHGKHSGGGISLMMLIRIRQRTGVAIDKIAAWYEMPAESSLTPPLQEAA